MKTLWTNILGWTFLILGIIGFFAPFLQGFLFTFIGLLLLSKTTPWAERIVLKLRKRYPNIARKSDEWIARFLVKSGSTQKN
jgi:uncharacterized membrane protein YbaN (DUF454 family)